VTHIGTIKAVNERGFAFLRPDHNNLGPKDVFVHLSEFKRAGLREPEIGERYEFEVQMSPKGPQAVDVRPVL
jgi:CspA family cold shock protein